MDHNGHDNEIRDDPRRDEDKVLDVCAICLEPICDRAVAVPCNHLDFCFVCLSTWVKQQAACPLCKSTLSRIEYDWRGPERYKVLSVSPPPRLPRYGSHERGPITIPRQVIQRNLAVEARQRVYRHGEPSYHIGCNPYSGHQTFTSHDFSESPILIRRTRIFLRRELNVFPFLRPQKFLQRRSRIRVQTHDYLIEFIIAVLKTSEVKGSDGKAEDLVAEFLGRRNARLLLHELQAWLQSPYNTLDEWDCVVQYSSIQT